MADSNNSTISKEEMARSAQTQAEKYFKAGNFFGAKQWMKSAARLAPDLPGNAQLAAAYDVHVAAARKGPDRWYAVLGLPDPRGAAGVAVTHDAVRRQHRKLCLLVHPDKNSSAAAGGAFKHVQDAFDALSARHPPSDAVPVPAPPQAPAPERRPPDPGPEPPKPRPQVVQMQRTAQAKPPKAQTTTARAQKPQRPPPPPQSPRASAPAAGACPACGAAGSKKFRCGSCEWNPLDDRQDDDDYYDDY